MALSALLLAASGCRSPVYLGGEYRSRSHDLVSKDREPSTLVEDDKWTFLWGLFDTGTVDIHDSLEHKLRPNECFTDLDVRESSTVDGVILSWFTAGIVNHKEVVVRGKRAVRAPVEERSAE